MQNRKKKKKKCVVDLCTATPRDPEREREGERAGGGTYVHMRAMAI